MSGQLTAVSLFSGCGGFDWGANQAGVDIIWANDNYKHAGAAYQRLFPKVPFILGDVQDVEEFPAADVLIGCYPCTGFSLGARRRWRDRDRDLKDDDDNFLYLEFLRAIDDVRPKYLFVENVRGMLTAEEGWFFERQLQGFRKRGYTIKHQLLTGTEYGVPQTRKRVFIVGVRDDVDFDYRFVEPTQGKASEKDVRTLEDAIAGMPEWPKGEFVDKEFHGHYLTRNRKRDWDEPSYTIVANYSHIPLHPMGEPMKYVEKDTWILQGNRNRRLSWRECLAIQGLPQEAEPTGTLAHKHRVIGNAVPPAFGRVLLEPIIEFEENDHD